MNKKPEILLVEDNVPHAELIQRIFDGVDFPSNISHVQDGEEALNYLFKRGEYAHVDNPKPNLVLLDLHIPKYSGLEVLSAIKRDKELRRIPVVVLTSSNNHKEVKLAYENNANSYLVKPLDYGTFKKLINDICFYWLGWNYSLNEPPL